MIDKDLLTYLESYLTDNRKALFKNVLSQRTRHFAVVLEDIYQQHNSSAVLRSCDIFGVQDVYTIENNFTSKVSRHVAKGSQKWLTINRYKNDTNNTADCLQDLKAKGYQIIGTSPHYDSSLLPDFDISKKSAFVFGAEKDGISEYVKDNADGFLKVPMVGFTESLNISVAAAIILQDVTTRLRSSEVSWQLSENEKEVLYLDWTKQTIKRIDSVLKHYEEEIKKD